jgi:phosphocarrier protein HPr
MSEGSATRKVTVLNRAGLHARPSLAIVQAVRGSKSKVELRTPWQTVNAADILQILGLGVVQGTEIILTATGPDAQDVLDRLAEMFADQFGVCGD